jgi:hypothetical protein
MYQNPIIEMLSISSPQMMIHFHLILASIALYFGYKSSFTTVFFTILFIFIGGLVFWTFAEYALHRWIFHFVNESKVIKKIHYAVHGYHHSVPRDSKRYNCFHNAELAQKMKSKCYKLFFSRSLTTHLHFLKIRVA